MLGVNTHNAAPRCIDSACYELGPLNWPAPDDLPGSWPGTLDLMHEVDGIAYTDPNDPRSTAPLKPNFAPDIYSRENPLPLFFQNNPPFDQCGNRKRPGAYTWSQGSNFRPRGTWHNNGLWSFSHTTVTTTEFVNVFIRFDYPMDIWLGPHSMQHQSSQTEYFRHIGICDEYYPGPGAVVNRRINNTPPFQYQDTNAGPSWFVFRNRLEVGFTVRPWNAIYSGVHLRLDYGVDRFVRRPCRESGLYGRVWC